MSGSFFALLISAILLGVAGVYVTVELSLRNALPIFLVAGTYAGLLHIILMEYRPLRCKEVDTVFHACFINRERFKALLFDASDCEAHVATPGFKRARRKQLLQGIWQERDTEQGRIASVALADLIRAMKSASVKKETSFLSSLYFAGADVDHPFFLQNDRVAIGIAVLPEDKDKAGTPKRHPCQTEIVVVLEGSLNLFCRQQGKEPTKHSLEQGEHFVISKSVCHWIEPVGESDAAYMFVKTDPNRAPKEESCVQEMTEE